MNTAPALSKVTLSSTPNFRSEIEKPRDNHSPRPLCAKNGKCHSTGLPPVFNQNHQSIDSGTEWLDHFARKAYAFVKGRPVSNNSI